MAKIVISENITLDGVVQDPSGAEGFRLGGWVGRVGEGGREETCQRSPSSLRTAIASKRPRAPGTYLPGSVSSTKALADWVASARPQRIEDTERRRGHGTRLGRWKPSNRRHVGSPPAPRPQRRQLPAVAGTRPIEPVHPTSAPNGPAIDPPGDRRLPLQRIEGTASHNRVYGALTTALRPIHLSGRAGRRRASWTRQGPDTTGQRV
jgi:hypothetical protein